MLGKIEERRRRGHQKMRWLPGITDVLNMNLGTLTEMVRDREAWHVAVHALQSQTWLGDWTTLGCNDSFHISFWCYVWLEIEDKKFISLYKSEILHQECVLVVQSCPTLSIPWTLAHQTPLSMEFSRQEYWSGLPYPFSRVSFHPRDQTRVSCIAGRFFTFWATREDQE